MYVRDERRGNLSEQGGGHWKVKDDDERWRKDGKQTTGK